MTALFISLAKHQGRYFNRLINETDVQGKVVTPQVMPWPRTLRLPPALSKVDLESLIDEKCQERRVKNKTTGSVYRLLLRLELIWMSLRIQALLDREQPDILGVWNGAHRYCRLLIALAPPECKIYFFENGLLPGTTTVDGRGVNYLNSVPRDAAFYTNYPYPLPDVQEATSLIPRKPRTTSPAPILLPERYIFIPFQDDRDSQVRLFSPWISDMREMFALGERLSRETGLPVIFKEHPSSRQAYPDLHAQTSDRLMFANGNTTQQLITDSLFVVTINSTVGLESLLLGKPVMTLGQAFFNVEGLVVHADNAEQAIAAAKAFPEWPLNERLRCNFLHYLAEHYCIKGHWKTADSAHLARVAARILEKSSAR
jgi:capsular polysaccharide export protein